MLAIVYLIISLLVGFIFINIFLPDLNFKNWMVLLPASFITGILFSTWITYIFTLTINNVLKYNNPLLYGNLCSFTILFIIIFVYFIKNKNFINNNFLKNINKKMILNYISKNKIDFIYLFFITTVWTYFMFRSFSSDGNKFYVGWSVFSDFAPHLSMIRSFSFGSNFPTEYSHFPDGHIRYHFMFQFLVGNLEYLGLRLDYAFNVPSILSMISFLILLYNFVTILTGKKVVGIITSILFFFRSSFAFFSYYNKFNNFKDFFNDLKINTTNIGTTLHEDWGLFAQKVYVNQRHLAFSLSILMLSLIVMLPLFLQMMNSLKNIKKNRLRSKNVLNELFLKNDCFSPKSYARSVFIGVLLGFSGFFNGAVLIAVLPILFVIAIMSKHRLEFLIIAGIACSMFLFEIKLFLGAGSSTKPEFYFGFLADPRNFYGVLNYYYLLLGIMPIVLIASLFFIDNINRWLCIAFFTPFLMANVLKLTPDITVNHKYIIISVILLNIPISYFIYKLYHNKKVFPISKLIAAIIIFLMTITGVVDIITLYNLDKNKVALAINDKTMLWVKENSNPNEIFLTYQDTINPILLAGRKIFYGHPYYAWSAGYDTDKREKIVNSIYGSKDKNDLKRLVKDNKISYIVIGKDNRTSQNYKLNERLIANCFTLKYKNDLEQIYIYKTN